MAPLVSVIIPAYNVESYISDCIKSIIQQAYSNLEILVIDDASTDRTVKVVESFKDQRIRVIKNKTNLGLAASVNLAISQSHGQFLARMDADDISLRFRISKQVDFMKANPAISILGSAMQSFGHGHYTHHFPVLHDHCKAQLLFNVCFGHPTVMFRREIFDNGKALYDEALKQYSEEYDLWCRLVDTYQFANLPEVLLHYRTFPSTQKTEGGIKRRANSYVIRSRFLYTQWEGKISESACKIHDHLANVDRAADQEEFLTWIHWLEEMQVLNLSNPSFSPEALKQQLAERTFEIYYWNTHLSFFNWVRWRRKKERFNPGVMKQIKFFLRSVLHK